VEQPHLSVGQRYGWSKKETKALEEFGLISYNYSHFDD